MFDEESLGILGIRDVKGLDPWGDSDSKAMDIVAIYEKEEPDPIQFRLDFLDLPTDVITPTHFALDFMTGGSTLMRQES